MQSEPGQGNPFEVFHLSAMPPAQKPTVREAPPPPGECRSAVVVDDEPMLPSLSGKILDGLGYQVRAFTDSGDALEFLLAGGGAVDTGVTDQTMPRITGLELAGRLHGTRPGIPVLFTTGYSEALSTERLEKAGIGDVLMKPFNRTELGRALANLFMGA